MCGVAGIVSDVRVDPAWIDVMTSCLSHRGPDAHGIYFSKEGNVALGHTRLSIIDLSADANQPMYSADNRYIIVFNGEIYNYKILSAELCAKFPELRFRTGSDTEIILEGFARLGHRIFEKLDGMFALAIYDQQEKRLTLCRDKIGKKPLFYYHANGQFIFSSEIKSLLKLPPLHVNRKVNPSALYTFLHLGYIPEPDTAYLAIKKFPAASYGVVENNHLNILPFWNIVDHALAKKDWTEKGAISALRNAVTNAVEKRLISDVPVGAFLSGGTDSSLVVAVASKLKQDRLKTFTIGFKESKFDETTYAREVATHLNTDHQTYILHESEALGILETYIRHFDEPFADTSAIPSMLVAKLAKKEVSVALTGDGGDEFFLGYGAYDWAHRLQNPVVKLFGQPASLLMKTFGNNRVKRISHMFEYAHARGQRSHIFSQEQYFFSQHEISHKLAPKFHSQLFTYNDPPGDALSEAERQALFDVQYYLKDDLLVKVDRASMYSGLECRCPLLDVNVVELALSFKSSLKKKDGERKWMLKQLLREYLPGSLVDRPKWGFSVPLERWLRGELKYLIDQYLAEDVIQSVGMVEYAYVKKIKDAFLRGENYLYNRLWVLIALHKWLTENAHD
jgi:asparagine synthase (glutamine-hydrolysing)